MNTNLNLSDALGDSISEEEALSLIKSEPDAFERFQDFAPDDRKTILEFIQGQRGLKIIYDPFFKKIFSPTYHPKRLEGFLSELLEQQVPILAELNDTKEQLTEKDKLLAESQKALTDKDNLLADKDSIIARQLAELAKYKKLYGDNNISK